MIPERVKNGHFRHGQIVTACLVSLAHGAGDHGQQDDGVDDSAGESVGSTTNEVSNPPASARHLTFFFETEFCSCCPGWSTVM